MPTLDIASYSQFDYISGAKTNELRNCVAACLTDGIRWFTGEFLNPDWIHDQTFGDASTRGFTFPDAERFCDTHHYPATAIDAGSREALLQEIKRQIDANRPVLIAYDYTFGSGAFAHAVLAIGYDDTKVYCAEPTGGIYSDFQISEFTDPITGDGTAAVPWRTVRSEAVTWQMDGGGTLPGSKASDGDSAMPPSLFPPPKPAATPVYDPTPGILLTWAVVPKATSYEVLRFEVEEGPSGAAMDYLAVTTDTRYVDADVTPGDRYHYRVIARKPPLYSVRSEMVEVTAPTAGELRVCFTYYVAPRAIPLYGLAAEQVGATSALGLVATFNEHVDPPRWDWASGEAGKIVHLSRSPIWNGGSET